MRHLILCCSLIAIFGLISCNKHDEVIPLPTPCELIRFQLYNKYCPHEYGEQMEVQLEAVFACDSIPNFHFIIDDNGHGVAQPIKIHESETGGLVTCLFKSVVTPMHGASVARIEYTMKLGSKEFVVEVTCPIPDPPDEPCEVTGIIIKSKTCPQDKNGQMEVVFDIIYQCKDLPPFSLHVAGQFSNENHFVVNETQSGNIWTRKVRSIVTPQQNTSNVEATYTVSLGGKTEQLYVHCEVPKEECKLIDVTLYDTYCPTIAGEPMKSWINIIYECDYLPSLDLQIIDGPHHSTYQVVNTSQVGNGWIVRVEVITTPASGYSHANVQFLVSFDGATKSTTAACELPQPELCELVGIYIIDEVWITEEKVELWLEVKFESCTSIPLFNVEVTSSGHATIQHTGSYTQGNYLVYKIKSVVTAQHCQESIFVNYNAIYQGSQRTVQFTSGLCRFNELVNEQFIHPYQGDNKKAKVTFDVIFLDCRFIPAYNDVINHDIPGCTVTLDVISVLHQGNKTILKFTSEVTSTVPLYGRWIEYDISYCGNGVKLKHDF